MTQLDYRDPQSRYALLYPRCWHITAQVKDQLVLRCMDRGDFVAQATLTPWKKAEKGKHLTAEEFKQAMNSMAGWEAGEGVASRRSAGRERPLDLSLFDIRTHGRHHGGAELSISSPRPKASR